MNDVLFTPIRLNELEALIQNSVEKALRQQPKETGNQPEPEMLLTIQEAGEFLKLKVPTLYGLVQRATIPVCKRGKRLYFSKQELTEWIKAGRKKSLAETESEAINYINKKGPHHGK
jgi:excisionase family DNA binding protein